VNGDRFYTLLFVPEKTSKVRRFIIPAWVLKSAAIGLAFVVLLTGIMIFDYWYVMSQIHENKQLKTENRKLRQQVQIFQNRMATVENTMERVKTFSTRLKVIMNVEDQVPNFDGKLPDASAVVSSGNLHLSTNESQPHESADLSSATNDLTAHSSTSSASAAPSTSSNSEFESTLDPEKLELKREYYSLESRISNLTREAFETEEQLQDQYEILYDKKAFLAALPTRQPASGYFTSGFGVRTSPYGDRIKMHEGLDIANRLGTIIRAPADGEVKFAASKAGYGLTLILNHGYGIETWYGHLWKFAVKNGEKVKRGTKIALLGNSGRSTGPHVHYEVRVHGYPVDPRSYIFEDSTP
jgi:murein DD-endopeptidase MepM/ murein hydrolase activator NlpD